MKITDAQLLALVIDMANVDRADDGYPLMTEEEVADMSQAFSEGEADNRDRTRAMIEGLVASAIKHLGLREPRDETLITLPVFGPDPGGRVTPLQIPAWVFAQAQEVETYMDARGSSDWKFGGIQKRVD